MPDDDIEYLSQGTDYLGFLNAKLRDLRGYGVLASELIQNADDAKNPTATEIVFDFQEDALLVENNAVFSDCQQMGQRECPWRNNPQIKHRCDFHRFRHVAGADKRQDEGTTGAFGIGFIAVYQITNYPEVISSGRHWRLRPDAPEEQRIEARRDSTNHPGTRFRLPWATDVSCALRQRLGVPAIASEDVQTILQEVSNAAPKTLLFLKHLNLIEVRQNGKIVRRVERLQENGQIIVQDDEETRLWFVFQGDFQAEAASLRARHGTLIEAKRKSAVTIALPNHELESAAGVFCATLPTQHPTRLPLSINADFFPESNRKRISFERGYEGEWNEGAVRAAASTLAAALPRLPELLDHRELWALLAQTEKVFREAREPESVLKAFWEYMRPKAPQSDIVYTSTQAWTTPGKAQYLLNRDQEQACLPLLEALEVAIVHPDLNEHQNLLRGLGTRELEAAALAQALLDGGFDHPMPLEDVPACLRTKDQRQILADEIALLLKRRDRRQDEARELLAACAIVLSEDGWLCPPEDVWQTSEEVQETLAPLGLQRVFAAQNPEGILNLVPELDAEGLVQLLERVPQATFEDLWGHQSERLLNIMELLSRQGDNFRKDTSLRSRLCRLQIWPSGATLHPLDELVVPGDFVDPFGLASILDEQVVACCRTFLTNDLQATTLTLQNYAQHLIPRRFAETEPVDATQCRRLVEMLAEHLGKIEKDLPVRAALSSCPLVECRDGLFRNAPTVYFPEPDVLDILGRSAPTARLSEEHPTLIRAFYQWLGVAEFPPPSAVVRRIQEIAQQLPVSPHRPVMARVFAQLGKRWAKYRERYEERLAAEFQPLLSSPWLPVQEKEERWYKPSEVQTIFQNYLFETTGQFLDISREDQQACSDLIRFLRIATEPTSAQVVNHLLNCSCDGKEVNKRVYSFLTDHTEDDTILRLRGQACILLGTGTYVRPDQVFWQPHGFQPYLYQLGEDFRPYQPLFKRLEVKEYPEHQDAIRLLRDIATQNQGNRLDEITHGVIMRCWTLLGYALERNEITPSALQSLYGRTIPDKEWYLNPPSYMFFEDRPHLAKRFGDFFDRGVITRTEGAWRAMEAVGVRLLSKVVKVQVVDHGDPAPADDIQSILRERRPLLERVLQPERAEGRAGWDLSILDRLQICRCAPLTVGYTTHAFGTLVSMPPEPVPAHFDQESGILYVVREAEIPWSDVARVLASALNPEAVEGKVAPGLYIALSAPSLQNASAMLDGLGVPPLEQSNLPEVADSAPVGLGGQEAPDEEDDVPYTGTAETQDVEDSVDTEDEPDEVKHAADTESPHAAEGAAPNSGSSDTSAATATGGTARAQGTGDGRSQGGASSSTGGEDEARDGTSPPSDGHTRTGTGPKSGTTSTRPKGDTPAGDNRASRRDGSASSRPTSTSDRSRSSRSATGGRLRTYVFPSRGEDEGNGTASDAAERISETDRAGIERVLQAERQAGRIPRVMAHNHPGYDIESQDADGNEIERYIEVKSLSGNWTQTGVTLSGIQFREAQQRGERYWLYVVERAAQEDFHILRIPNPAQKANEFLFDDGWRDLQEDAGSVQRPRSILDLSPLARSDSEEATVDDDDETLVL